MLVEDLLNQLGYAGSPNFLHGDELAYAGDHGHVFRQAQSLCDLHGVYALRPAGAAQTQGTVVPMVYVCEASSTQEADIIHRRVWNQNIVPFLIVLTPRMIRLYSGFRYARGASPDASGILHAAIDFDRAMTALSGLTAEDIDDGALWTRWGHEVTMDSRVDWQLLGNLETLGQRLLREGMSKRDANALIGKYVYLRYLRDRDILSDRKLDSWGIQPDKIFGRHATLKAFYALVDHLNEWLNGSVFPLPDSLGKTLARDQLRYVAGVFGGDDAGGQLSLFDIYDFSFIPIETLSVIYEQFLHAQELHEGQPGAREIGAYYTPIPLVDFMLDQMDRHRPLRSGMRVIDPACGSGAFLVQCYRRLIERTLRDRGGARLRPTELRELLTQSMFGVDSDPDACQVAELSLILTLLDYLDPPDLGNTSFKLPALRNRNLFCCDAFDLGSPWVTQGHARGYDWIVGNPPWKEFKKEAVASTHPHLAAWLADHEREMPIGDNQIAEAFAWRACELAADDGIVGFLVPAMTLFKHSSRSFRAALFRRTELFQVANFANLAEVLFAGRSRVPAAALFYAVSRQTAEGNASAVISYAPFLANQETNRPTRKYRRMHTWSIVVNASELREIPYREIIDGDSLPWKLAMWGSPLDRRLVSSVSRRCPSLGELEGAGRLTISEGLQLRAPGSASEAVEHHPELTGTPLLLMPPLSRLRDFFSFPASAIGQVDKAKTDVRRGRHALPLRICQPPHVIVSAARTFAIYSNELLIVPPRQIGIAADPSETDFLKALSLYLSSDFTRYHQILTSTLLGIKQPRATLASLRELPIAIADASPRDLTPWVALHGRLCAATEAAFADPAGRATLCVSWVERTGLFHSLMSELDELVCNALRLDRRSRALIHDLVHVKMALDDGKLGKAAVRPPAREELRAYADMLRTELDEFVARDDARHAITMLVDDHCGMIEVALQWADEPAPAVSVLQAGDAAARTLARVRVHLREQRSQWLYFDRNLRVYQGEQVYLLKPMQRLHWTQSQALIDAGEIIADTLVGASE